MLEYLKDKKDVGFFLSIQALMQTCWSVLTQILGLYIFFVKKKKTLKNCYNCICFSNSVLDLNAFERQNKAEGLGMVSEEGTSKSGPS